MKLIFATANEHKVQEIRAMLQGICDVVPMSEVGIHHALPEDFDTLELNSSQKAEYIYSATGQDCFADDTGLEVEILGGAPGAFSARFAGNHCSPNDNIVKLLALLEGKSHRTARFRTVITLILHGQRHQFAGTVDGEILTQRRGEGGFGYDPIFRPLGYNQSFAEMPPDLKNQISHRGRALQAMVDFLKSKQ